MEARSELCAKANGMPEKLFLLLPLKCVSLLVFLRTRALEFRLWLLDRGAGAAAPAGRAERPVPRGGRDDSPGGLGSQV